MSCNDESFNPVTLNLGQLPETPTQDNPKAYPIPESIPAGAKSLLFYAFATTESQSEFCRGYYEIFTQKDDTKYKMYMNFATGTTAAVTITSANVWLPITTDKKVYVSLIYPKNENVAHKTKTPVPKELRGGLAMGGEEWSNLFITGWK